MLTNYIQKVYIQRKPHRDGKWYHVDTVNLKYIESYTIRLKDNASYTSCNLFI